MLSDDEQRFLSWWEANREKEKKTIKQWLVGLPLGLLFGIPIFINFLSGWYKKAGMIVNTQISNRDSSPLVIMIAVLLIISFVAIFSKRLRWEKNEQPYRELKARTEGKNLHGEAADDIDR